MLSMNNISKVFRTDLIETHALRHFSLEVKSGEFVAVTGPSGSGKTTFLNIAGLLEPYESGTYKLDDIDVTQLSDDARSRLRNDRVGWNRDVVAAGGGEIRHRGHDRTIGILFARNRQLTPDHVRRHRRSARAVYTNHNRLDRLVVANLADLFDDRLGPRDRAVHRIKPTLARRNRPDNVEDGNSRARPDAD